MCLAERFPGVGDLAAYLWLWRKWLILLWQCLQWPEEVKGELEELVGYKGGIRIMSVVTASSKKENTGIFQDFFNVFVLNLAQVQDSIAKVILDNILHLQDITVLCSMPLNSTFIHFTCMCQIQLFSADISGWVQLCIEPSCRIRCSLLKK